MRRSQAHWISILLILLLMGSAFGRALAQEQVIHTVQRGENLFRISLRYGVTMDSVMAANNLTDPHRIYAGQQLVIPGAASNAPTAEAEAEPPVGGVTYTVQRGDTVSAIAARFGVSVWILAQANEIRNPAIIFPGDDLTIPGAEPVGEPAEKTQAVGTYTVQRGDTLYRIAKQNNTTTNALAYLNGIANPSTIYVGQVLRIAGADSVPAPPGTDKRILVDLSEQHLYAFSGDQLVYSFVASTGAPPSNTRTGQFQVQSKVPNAYGATWDIWMPHWLGIYWVGSMENGIHALPILSNGQTLWAGYLGTPISYGCVVLGTYEAQLLYEWAEMGTPVLIQY